MTIFVRLPAPHLGTTSPSMIILVHRLANDNAL
jgi:hypothetical protein